MKDTKPMSPKENRPDSPSKGATAQPKDDFLEQLRKEDEALNSAIERGFSKAKPAPGR